MAFQFVPLDVSQQPDLVKFLVDTFRADTGLPSFRPDVIRWKYFVPHPQWISSRSWAVKQNGQIVAHAGIWPVRLKANKSEINAIHLIDWAASRSAVGAGVYLLRKIAGLADVLITIGGSDHTKSLLPKLGYECCGELRTFARVIRPWSHFLTTPQKDWKTPVKLARNSISAFSGIPPAPQGWQAKPITSFTDSMDPVLISPTPSSTSPLRTVAGLDHLLSCPAASFSAFQITQGGQERGYFVLAKIGKQARIVDMRLTVGERESLQAGCSIAARTAAEDPEISEVAAASSIQTIQKAWEQAGLSHRQTDPIFGYDPRSFIPNDSPLNLTMADGDQCFLSDPCLPYLL